MVDAGGRGLCVLLDALVEVVTGGDPVARCPMARVRARAAGDGPGDRLGRVRLRGAVPARRRGRRGRALRAELAALGDSLVVVGTGDGGTWNVHVHVNDVGAAIEAGVRPAGRTGSR